MANFRATLALAFTLFFLHSFAVASAFKRADDSCAKIGGQKWVAASDVRACYDSFPVNETLKANIIEVISKTLAFHTSTNYQIQAPAPYTEVHEDILADLSRISSQPYSSDFELHVDLSNTLRRLKDGHSVYINMCYDSTFTSYVPAPLALLEDADGQQSIYIAPDAYEVVTHEFFANQTVEWQAALEDGIELDSIAGAKVVQINGADPWDAVNANADIAGSFQSAATRQNAFFSSYAVSASAWSYYMGQFAQTALPLQPSVNLTIQRVNSTSTDTITLPYRSHIHDNAKPFTDAASFWSGNCLAVSGTNGASLSSSSSSSPVHSNFLSHPSTSKITTRPPILDVMLDVNTAASVPMPASLQPPTSFRKNTAWDNWFYMLDDGVTGVVVMSNFEGSEISLMVGVENGIEELKDAGATRLIIDVQNNSGGLVCVAEWLHRIIAGNKTTTEPQSGLYTKARSSPLAQKIVAQIVADPNASTDLLYNPMNWKSAANETAFPKDYNWMVRDTVNETINGRADLFSQKLGQTCQPFYYLIPEPKAEFDLSQIVIISNGRCASSCALFVTTMAKEEKVKIVSVGGKKGVTQQYAGTVGGESLDFSAIDSAVKSAGLKGDPDAPPDFLTNSYQGITWRLAFGVDDISQPEEWQNREPSMNVQLTAATVNRPWALWKDVASKVFN